MHVKGWLQQSLPPTHPTLLQLPCMHGQTDLLVLTVVACHSAMGSLGLDGLSIRAHQHGGHQAEGTKACRGGKCVLLGAAVPTSGTKLQGWGASSILV